jgi:hypothetical protein
MREGQARQIMGNPFTKSWLLPMNRRQNNTFGYSLTS